jgi:excisionase family DNA binding protein
MSATNPTNTPLAYRPEQVSNLTGLSRGKIFQLIASGELESRKIGKARLVLARSLEKLLEGGE